MKKVYLIGELNEMGLECSYESALKELGMEVRSFHYPAALAKQIRFGKFGKTFQRFVSVEPWVQKMNKEIALDIKKFQPDVVFVFTNAPIQAGSIAFIKSILPTKFILVWPDTLCNLGNYPLMSRGLYDGVASHGRDILPVLRQMGFNNPVWIPFAVDKRLHNFDSAPAQFDYDISFVGSWNKEREDAMAAILKGMPQRRIAIFGPNWDRAATDFGKRAISKPLRGAEYAGVFNRSFINVNVIGEIAYPSVNMRFFEIPVAYGFQIVNSSPEHAATFREGEHLAYFNSNEELLKKIDYFLGKPDEAMRARTAAHALVSAEHTYKHRMIKLLEHIQTIS